MTRHTAIGNLQSPPEKTIFRGKPPLVLIFLRFDCLLYLLTFWLIVPLFPLIWEFLKILCTKYFITTERILVTQGIFNITTDELKLFRVRDMSWNKPFLYRFFSLGKIRLTSTDRNNSELILDGLPKVEFIFEVLERCVTIQQKNHPPFYS